MCYTTVLLEQTSSASRPAAVAGERATQTATFNILYPRKVFLSQDLER